MGSVRYVLCSKPDETFTLDTNPCNSRPCQNNGLCISYGAYFLCTCPVPFSGTLCEMSRAPVVITCCPPSQIVKVRVLGQGATVFYPPAETAPESAILTNYTHQSGSFFPFGMTQVTVTAYTQSCGTGAVEMDQCTFEVSVEEDHPVNVNPCVDFPCQNDGTCSCLGENHYACTCTPEYGGLYCVEEIAADPELDACSSQPCKNNGVCYNGYNHHADTDAFVIQYTCVCPLNFSGTNCEIEIEQSCQEATVDMCRHNICMNGGVCHNAYFSDAQRVEQFCICPLHFVGQYCEVTDNTPCSSNPCSSDYLCRNFDEFNFICICKSTTNACDVEPDPIPRDTSPPVFVYCPVDTIVNVASFGQTAQVTYLPAQALDDSDVVQVSYSYPSGSTFTFGLTSVTATARDASGNTALCGFNVNVTDEPVYLNVIITCPPDQVIRVPWSVRSTRVDYPAAQVNDFGGRDPLEISYKPPGRVFPVGITTVTVIVTISKGHFRVGQFTVTVLNGLEDCDFSERAGCDDARSPTPEKPWVVKTKFFLFNGGDQIGKELNDRMNKDDFLRAGYDSTKPLKVVIHGFRSAHTTDYIADLRKALQAKGTYNVIAVCWENGAKGRFIDFNIDFPTFDISIPFWRDYLQAAQNTRLVAKQLQLMLEALHIQTNLTYANVHLIGHSLGAQVSGLAGAMIKSETNQALIGRITGLDSAGPVFDKLTAQCRLDKSDAMFVDAIHTDSQLLGSKIELGNADFWVNGGKSQPDCRVPYSCSHRRSATLFTNSVKGDCSFPTRGCVFKTKLLVFGTKAITSRHPHKKQCLKCANMGINATNGRINISQLCLYTKKVDPYCEIGEKC
ncbi:uncharacterized protein [Amphiura filiformis]|uniref:uncharacterized protein n=1 Tax=Amphiura filiformis TaxID=82378 RepID=UPI003B21DD1E